LKKLEAMATEGVLKFFYRSGVITTIVGSESGMSLMRKNYSVLAALGEGEHSRIFACDKQGSVMLDMCRESNAHQRFTPYGFSTRIPLSPVAFKGDYFDPISQGYPLGTGYRAYSPILMRFKSPDSLSPFGVGGLNPYAFVVGDPINLNDIDGHSPTLTGGSRFYYRGPIRVIDGLRVFYTDGPSGKKVLNIGAHGFPGRIGSHRVNHRASVIADTLQKNGVDLAGQETHILACQSANRQSVGGLSFIEEMANITKAPSTGYKDSLWTDDNRPAIINGGFEKYWIKLIKEMEVDDPDFARFAYRPITVNPSSSSAVDGTGDKNQFIRAGKSSR